MTAYNREKYIADAIESVLASSYSNFELIIVDDCSIDNTVKIALEYAACDSRLMVFINESNMGDYRNRNKASQYAKGKYIKYVDSDDMIYPNTLEYMVLQMEQHPEAGFGVSSRTESKCKIYSPLQAYYTHFYVHGLLDNGPTAVIIHRTRFIECGGFKEIRNVSDYDLWLRMAAKYPVVEMPKGLIYWREHNLQEINLAPKYYLEYNLKIIRQNVLATVCPLSKSQKREILYKLSKQTFISIVKEFIKQKNFKYFTYLIKVNFLNLDKANLKMFTL